MSFRVIYYMSMACPTVEKTQEMVDKYVEHGAKAFQIDMPSHDPYGETDFVKAQMAAALAAHPDYDYYMDVFRAIRRKHPDVELNVVVYKDVIDAIGIEKFAAFCKEIGARTVRQAGTDEREAYTRYLNAQGLVTVEAIDYHCTEEALERARRATCFVTLRTRRKTESPVPQFATWKQRIDYVHEHGVTAPVFAIADMKTAEDLNRAKEGGADGTIVGNVLMQLWDNEDALWKKFDELQGCAED